MTETQTERQEVAEEMSSSRDHRSPCRETPCCPSCRFPEQVSVHSSFAWQASHHPFFVSLGMKVGSTTGFVSVLILLELVPDTSVGVLTKIFPLRCRGSDTGGSGWN